LVTKCFKEQSQSVEWQEKLKKMIPSFGQTLNDKPEFLAEIRKTTSSVLKLNE